jgi:maltose alpha-D-glucosyltransferase/alpha-amylase
LTGVIDELRAARWFGGKNRVILDTRLGDRVCAVDDASICLVAVEYADGPPETYVMAERLDDRRVAMALLERFGGSSIPSERGGRIEFRPTHLFGAVGRDRLEPVAIMRGEQSNTSIRFGHELILKLFRRLQFGPNPEVEVGRFLTDYTAFRNAPPVVGSASYIDPQGREGALALLQRFEPNRGDAWTTTLLRVRGVLEGGDASESVKAMARLGETTAELHLALASGTGDFSAEPITDSDIAAWLQAVEDEVRLATDALTRQAIQVDTAALLRRAEGLAGLSGALKTRHHGDYHLGQVLEREDGSFVIIDFEGEPAKPLALRREKRSPLRDVAGMLRSFDYARHTALRSGDRSDPARIAAASAWYAAVRDAFLSTYVRRVTAGSTSLLPGEIEAPLAALELEKAAYEVLYELNNRPDWLPIPLAALSDTTCL